MNWLVIIVCIILLACALVGRQVGFIRTVFSVFSTLLVIGISIVVTPYVGKMLRNNETVYNKIYESIEKNIDFDKETKTVADEKKVIDNLKLPTALKEALIENNNTEIYKALVVKNFKDYICHYVASVAINGIAFFIVMVVTAIIMVVLEFTLRIFSRLPIINGLNKTAGLLVGFMEGLILIWILCIIITAFSGANWTKEIFQCIEESELLSRIYNNNLLLKAITNMSKVLF